MGRWITFPFPPGSRPSLPLPPPRLPLPPPSLSPVRSSFTHTLSCRTAVTPSSPLDVTSIYHVSGIQLDYAYSLFLVFSVGDKNFDVLPETIEDELLRHLLDDGLRAHVGAYDAHAWVRLLLLRRMGGQATRNRPIDRPSDRSTEQTTNKVTDRPRVRPINKTTDQPIEINDGPTNSKTDRPTDQINVQL